VDREFIQTGVELIGAGGPAADAEVVWLADWSLRSLGVAAPRVRVGHVGLILELLGGAGLPPAATSALIESLSEAASEGKDVKTLEAALDRLTAWLGATGAGAAAPFASPEGEPDPAVDRLFRHLVPDVTGRRSGGEIVGRLRAKWALEPSLHGGLENVRGIVRSLSELRGPAADVLGRLDREFAARAPGSVAAIVELCDMLDRLGVDLGRVELDLGFGRGIGFYTQMIFELAVDTPGGPVEVCGGGRYDGLARVLGGLDRDDRGAGFAFGLERLDQALAASAAPVEKPARGWLVTGEPRRAAALAAFLRDRVDLPVVTADLEIEPAVAYAKSLGLDRIVAAGAEVEVWDLEHGDVRQVREGELIEQLKGRLTLAGEDVR
jgi:histidyl-tRNA synthetase